MPGNPVCSDAGIGGKQETCHCRQLFILDSGKDFIIATLQFDANGEVVALITACVTGHTGMIGFQIEWHKLGYLPCPVNQQMRLNPQVFQCVKVRMGRTVEPVAEKIVNPVSPVFTWRQADVVNDKKTDVLAIRPVTAVG